MNYKGKVIKEFINHNINFAGDEAVMIKFEDGTSCNIIPHYNGGNKDLGDNNLSLEIINYKRKDND